MGNQDRISIEDLCTIPKDAAWTRSMNCEEISKVLPVLIGYLRVEHQMSTGCWRFLRIASRYSHKLRPTNDRRTSNVRPTYDRRTSYERPTNVRRASIIRPTSNRRLPNQENRGRDSYPPSINNVRGIFSNFQPSFSGGHGSTGYTDEAG